MSKVCGIMNIVLVRWVDAASVGDWRSHKAMWSFVERELSPIQTVGIQIFRDEKKIVLIQTYSENQVIGLFEIPMGCVRDIQHLGQIEGEIEI